MFPGAQARRSRHVMLDGPFDVLDPRGQGRAAHVKRVDALLKRRPFNEEARAATRFFSRERPHRGASFLLFTETFLQLSDVRLEFQVRPPDTFLQLSDLFRFLVQVILQFADLKPMERRSAAAAALQ